MLDPLLEALPRWVFVAGKGGVGKTTCAAALAARAAQRDGDTLVLSTDPARSLGAALGTTVGDAPGPVPSHTSLFAMQLDAQRERDRFLERWGDVLRTILDRGTYLSGDDIAGIVDDALPGADEAMAVLALLELERTARWQRVIVDTAPTGHTLRLLGLPAVFQALIALLDTMQAKHRFMVQALARRYRADAADAFLSEMRARIDALRATLTDARRTGVVLVTRPEPVVLAESGRYVQALHRLGMHVNAVIVNAVPDESSPETSGVAPHLPGLAPGTVEVQVPLAAAPPATLADIEALFARGASTPERAARRAPPYEPSRGAAGRLRMQSLEEVLRPLTIVAGKGGVGKTTVACALAVGPAQASSPVLIVSSDPAPSVTDVLEQAVGDEVVPVHGADGVFAQQLDAAAAFDGFRARYSHRVDELFGSLVRRGMSLAHDQAVMRNLLALAPPGIDELYALVTLGDLLHDDRYARVIVDPAPTGHLLRLLEMPGLALSWSHRVMRIMLEFKEVAALGEAARELLDFSKRTRALRERLADPASTTVIVVANDEPLVRDETSRLVAACRARAVHVGACVWNRASADVRPLSDPVVDRQFQSPKTVPAPRGADALRSWCATWRALEREIRG